MAILFLDGLFRPISSHHRESLVFKLGFNQEVQWIEKEWILACRGAVTGKGLNFWSETRAVIKICSANKSNDVMPHQQSITRKKSDALPLGAF
jgi:hypothetical protein